MTWAALLFASTGLVLGCGPDGIVSSGDAMVGTDSGESDVPERDAANVPKTFSLQYVAIWGKGGIGGEGPSGRGSGEGEFSYPTGIGLSPDEHEVFIFDTSNGRIVVMSAGGAFLRSWPTVPQTACGEAAQGLVVGLDGTVYTFDTVNHGVIGYTPTGEIRSSWPLQGAGELCGPWGQHHHPFAVDADGNIYVGEVTLKQVLVFRYDGTFIRTIGGPGPGKGFMFGPLGIAWADGWVYATDGDRILVYRDTGEFDRAILTRSTQGHVHSINTGITASKGWLFVATDDPPAFFAQAPGDTGLNYIWQTVKGLSATQMREPFAMAIDSRGRWYVSEMYNARIQVFDAALPTL